MRNLFYLSVAFLVLWSLPLSAQNKKPDKPNGDSNQTDLINRLGDTAADVSLPLLARTGAINAIGKIKGGKATGQQIKTLQKFLSRNYLGNLDTDDNALFFLIHVAQALGNIGPAASEVLPDLLKARGHEANLNSAVDMAVSAIQGKKAPGDGQGAKSVKDLLADLANAKDVIARLAAAKALGNFADPTVIGPLSTTSATDPDPDVQLVAGRALKKVTDVVQLNTQQFQASLVVMLDKSNDIAVRVMAAKALGRVGAMNATKATIDALKVAGNDDDADLKAVAQNALKRIQ